MTGIFQKSVWLVALLLTVQFSLADFVPAPNAQNLFNHDGNIETNAGPGLWITPLATNQRPTQSASQTIGNIPQNVSNVLSSSNSNQLFNNLFNNGLLNQIGVGVKVNF